MSGIFIGSLTSPLLYSFSSLDYKKDYDKILKLYKTVFTYTLYIYIIITGLLFILSEFYLGFIYGNSYLYYSILIQLILIGNVVSIYSSLYFILLRTTNRIKQLIIITLIGYPYQIILFLVSVIIYGIVGMLIIDIFARIIWSGIYFILSVKVLKLRIDFLKIMILYLTFFFSLVLSTILGDLILDELMGVFWNAINLGMFENLKLLTLLCFLSTFFLLTIIFKTFTKEDVDKIQLLFTKDSMSHKLVIKILQLLRRFLR